MAGDDAAGQPVALFQTNIHEAGGYVTTDKQQYDVTADGQRFLMVQGGDANLTQLNVVVHRTFALPLLIFYVTARCNSRCVCRLSNSGGRSQSAASVSAV